MRLFTREELKQYNGNGRPTYIAYRGQVYDVSESSLWWSGLHQAEHPAGEDLTEFMRNAPHGPEMLKKFPIVGELKG